MLSSMLFDLSITFCQLGFITSQTVINIAHVRTIFDVYLYTITNACV